MAILRDYNADIAKYLASIESASRDTELLKKQLGGTGTNIGIGQASINVDGARGVGDISGQTSYNPLAGSGLNSINLGSLLGSITGPPVVSGKVWTAFQPGDIVPDVKQKVTEAIWSTGTGSLKTFFTSSAQSASTGNYYYDVYHANPATSTTAAVQFAIAYGHRLGSGSRDISGNSNVVGLTPSRAIYSQYRSLLLDPTDEQFTLANGKPVDSAVFITFNRARFKERIDAGNWELSLSGSNGSIVTLIDNYTPTSRDSYTSAGRVYNIVSGSLARGIHNAASPRYYGLIYPDFGILMLDGDMLNNSASVLISTASNTNANNHGRVLTAISGAAALSTPTNDYGFQARNEQEITSAYYFVRIKNGDYNFTNNQTFVSGGLGDLRFPEMYNDPRVYITTIGLYDNANQLLAVAKLSRPLQKSFSREALIRIKLDF